MQKQDKVKTSQNKVKLYKYIADKDINVKTSENTTICNTKKISFAQSLGNKHIAKVFKELESDDLTILLDESLARYSTMRVGGVARVVALPNNFGAFLRVFECARVQNFPYYILGNGSNTLCSSSGFDGVVICTKNMNKISFRALLHTPARKLQKCIFQSKKESATNAKHSKIANNNINISETNVHIGQNCAQNGNAEGKKNNTAYKQNVNFQKLPRKGLIKNATLIVFAECGALLPLLSKRACDLSYQGLEFACGIPASCGGAVKMNAGAFGGQMADIVSRVLIFNLNTLSIYYKYNENFIKDFNFLTKKHKKNTKNIKTSQKRLKNAVCEFLKFEYRKTNIADYEFVIGVEFVLRREYKNDIKKRCAENTRRRRQTQSVGYPSLGSVFKRNGDFIPSAFFDKHGFKGLSLGGAQVSNIHAGYIVNYSNATSEDILKLLKFLQNYICKISNIMLQYELKFLGDCNEKK